VAWDPTLHIGVSYTAFLQVPSEVLAEAHLQEPRRSRVSLHQELTRRSSRCGLSTSAAISSWCRLAQADPIIPPGSMAA
jgi:hypothetical protein